MAKLKMKKVEMIALQGASKALMEGLQRLGAVEPDEISDDRLIDISTRDRVSVLEKDIAATENALAILDEYAPAGGSMLKMLHGRREIQKKDYDELCDQADRYLKSAFKIVALRGKITDAKSEIARCQTMLRSLEVWRGLDIPMQYKGTSKTAVFVGTLPGQYTADGLNEALAQRCPEDAAVTEIVSSSKEQTAVMALCHKTAAERVYAALREMGFTLPSDPTRHPPLERITRLEETVRSEQGKLEQSADQIREYAKEREHLQLLLDYLTVKRDEYAALEKAKMTDRTVVVRGFVPEKCEAAVRRLAERHDAAVSFFEPEEDEDVPVLLQNNGFCEPVESITEMYALPGKKDIDPSSVMAFFYYLLFGMMLSDAGYGLIMTLGTGIILKKTGVEGNLRKTLKMFFFCGISTVFWGALFGSWFGDIVPIIFTNFLGKPAPQLALWFEPIQDPIRLLLFSFVIGICHLFLGLITAGRMKWQEGKRLDAFLDTVPIMLLVLGAAPLAAGVLVSIPAAVTAVAKYVAIAGMVLVVLTSSREGNIFARLFGGLYGLYNTASGYLSDILSYSRLLALGLATGSIAGVINMMGAMPENLVLKGILLTVVFLIGHPLNMAINLLGAYVHTNRLQFVELFSKFYEGGGRAFRPLSMHTKYIKFKEETENE